MAQCIRRKEVVLETIEASVAGHVSRWWQLIRDKITTWNDFEQSFLNKYWSREILHGITHKLEL